MKASTVISSCDKLKPNDYSYEQKREWLDKIESDIRIFAGLYSEEKPSLEFITDDNPELFLDKNEINIYVYYIISMIDLSDLEYSLYNNSSTFFNDAFDTWKKSWRMKHKPNCNTKTTF